MEHAELDCVADTWDEEFNEDTSLEFASACGEFLFDTLD